MKTTLEYFKMKIGIGVLGYRMYYFEQKFCDTYHNSEI